MTKQEIDQIVNMVRSHLENKDTRAVDVLQNRDLKQVWGETSETFGQCVGFIAGDIDIHLHIDRVPRVID